MSRASSNRLPSQKKHRVILATSLFHFQYFLAKKSKSLHTEYRKHHGRTPLNLYLTVMWLVP